MKLLYAGEVLDDACQFVELELTNSFNRWSGHNLAPATVKRLVGLALDASQVGQFVRAGYVTAADNPNQRLLNAAAYATYCNAGFLPCSPHRFARRLRALLGNPPTTNTSKGRAIIGFQLHETPRKPD